MSWSKLRAFYPQWPAPGPTLLSGRDPSGANSFGNAWKSSPSYRSELPGPVSPNLHQHVPRFAACPGQAKFGPLLCSDSVVEKFRRMRANSGVGLHNAEDGTKIWEHKIYKQLPFAGISRRVLFNKSPQIKRGYVWLDPRRQSSFGNLSHQRYPADFPRHPKSCDRAHRPSALRANDCSNKATGEQLAAFRGCS